MSEEGRGPADLGESTMPDAEDRDPPTRRGETTSPADADAADEDEGIGDKLKDAMGNVMGKAKGIIDR